MEASAASAAFAVRIVVVVAFLCEPFIDPLRPLSRLRFHFIRFVVALLVVLCVFNL